MIRPHPKDLPPPGTWYWTNDGTDICLWQVNHDGKTTTHVANIYTTIASADFICAACNEGEKRGLG